MVKNFTKTLFITIFVLFTSIEVNSQITITENQMPSSGDTIRYSSAASYQGFNPSLTGAGHEWDFSDLGLDNQDIYEYKLSGQTPYLFNFGFTAIGLKIADSVGTGQFALRNMYSFFQKTSTKYSAKGLGFQLSAFPLPLAGTYTSEDIIYNLPLNFGDSSTKSFSLSIPIGTGPFSLGTFYRTGERTTVVDGWGKISTPYQSNVSCIRVKSIINSRDSIATSLLPGGVAFSTNEVEYKWLVLGEKIPFLEIRGTQVGNTFTPISIRYRDIYRELDTGSNPVVLDFTVNKQEGVKGVDTFVFNSSSSVNPISYQWTFSPNSGIQYVNGTNQFSQNPSVVFANVGTYSVSLNVSTSIGPANRSKANIITINENLNHFTRVVASEGIRMYPNPASNRLFFKHIEEDAVVKLYSIDGKEVLSENISQQHSQITISRLPAGVYTVKVIGENNFITLRLIITENE